MRSVLRLGCAILVLALSIPSLWAGPAAVFRAGAAEVDITPPPGLPMYGYFERMQKRQIASGTLDPLYARVLVLEVSGRRLALVTLDLGRTFSEPWLDRLRTESRTSSAINALIVTASHTHSGPNILDDYPGGRLPRWQLDVLHKIEGAIRDATKRLSPARIGTGYGKVFVGYNRRRVAPDGTVTMLWSNPGKLPTELLDPTVTVIRIDHPDGSPMAILVGFACHPVVFGPDNLRYSADYVGVALRTVASSWTGMPVCLFLQGADGDINPFYATTPLNQGAVQKRDWTGQELGKEAARIAHNVRTAVPSTPLLQFADDVLDVGVRWNPQQLREGLLRADGPDIFQDHAGVFQPDPQPSNLDMHVTTAMINREIALAGMPGEPFVDFQIGFRDQCPVRHCLLLGYANGYFDYFPTILAASQGGYGAADSNTYVAVGAGERMLNHVLIRLRGMLGELTPVPKTDAQVFRVH